MGALSALPLVAAGNLCCCLWVVSGGAVAAYVLQQNEPGPITSGDGAAIGLMAGLSGAVIYLILSIPITLIFAPMQRELLLRILERANAGGMPPEFRDYVGSYRGGVIGIVVSFIFMLFVGAIFSPIGGLIGALVFHKPAVQPPAVPPPFDSTGSTDGLPPTNP